MNRFVMRVEGHHCGVYVDGERVEVSEVQTQGAEVRLTSAQPLPAPAVLMGSRGEPGGAWWYEYRLHLDEIDIQND